MTGALTGRRALVTGGTRGIGKGIVKSLLAEGASVVATGRDEAAGQELVALGSATFLKADLRDTGAVSALVEQAANALGGLDILVHCAGIYPEHHLTAMADQDWHDVLDTNLTSAMALVRAAVPALAAAGDGRIVLISSITGPRTAIAGLTHYAASKAGLEGFARAAAVELAGRGVTVNCVAPGTILTEGLAELYSAPGVMEDVTRKIPVGRIGDPADIGNAVAFLAGPGSSFITGQSITVDGGQTLPEVQG